MKLMMKAALCLVLAVLTIILTASVPAQAASAADFLIEQYQIAVVLKSDGSARITETISYRLFSRVTHYNYTINYADADSIRLEKIDVSSLSDTAATPVFIEVQPAQTASNQLQPLTYETKDNGRDLQIQLNALSEAGSQRTVRMTYELTHCVFRHQDAALLKRRFFGSGKPADIRALSLILQFPQAVSSLQTWYLPVSLAAFDVTQPRNDQLAFTSESMSADQQMILYCLMPMDIFPEATAAKTGRSWDALTAEARQHEAEIRKTQRLNAALTGFLYVLLALAILLVILIFIIFDREGAAHFKQKYLLTLPLDCTPAIAAIMLHRIRPGRLILSTLLDLVRRGELTLHGCVYTWIHPDRQDYAGFSAAEVFLIDWLFGHIAAGPILSTAEIRRFAREPATAQEFQAYYRQFRQLLDEEVVRQGLIDTGLTRKGRTISWVTSLIYLVLAIGATIGLRSAVGLHLLIPTVILALYGFQIRRLTIPGRELYARCRALTRTIRHYKRLSNQIDAQTTARILPFAVSFGLASRWLDQAGEVATQDKSSITDFCQAYGLLSGGKAISEQLQSLSADLQVMESMLSASLLLSSGIHW